MEMHSPSLISVIIPVYNGERYLRQAIESVLAQSYHPLEVIVVDDGSTDASITVAQQFAPIVKVVTQPNLGAGAARNHGVALAEGEFLAFLDADDLWIPEKLTLQIAGFAAQPEIDMFFGRIEPFNSPELTALPPLAQQAVDGFHAGTLLIRRAKFLSVGEFVTDRGLGEFIDWYARAQEQGLRHFMLPDIVMKRRRHDTNLTLRAAHERSEYLHVLKAALDRRRLKNPLPSTRS